MTLALVEPTGSEWELRQELGLWQRRFEHTYDQLSGVENRIGRALLEHNSNDVRPGPEPCPCERCEVLRGLLDEDQVGRVRKEAITVTVPVNGMTSTTNGGAALPAPRSATAPPIDWAAMTQERIDALKRGIGQVDEEVAQKQRDLDEAKQRAKQRRDGAAREIRALERALETYRHAGGAGAAPAREQPAGEPKKGVAAALVSRWIEEHGPRIVMAEIVAAAVADGSYATKDDARNGLGWHLRGRDFRAVERGVYERIQQTA